MAVSPDIRTKRLLITPFVHRYLSRRYIGWLNDQDVTRFSGQRHRKHTVESCRDYAESFENTPNYFWAILEMDCDFFHIGNINAYVDPANGIADIGIIIGEKTAWGKGYAAEAFETLFEFFIEKQGLAKITAGTVRPNVQMLKVMQKVGMVEDGIRRCHHVVEGVRVDVIHMAMFGERWVARKESPSCFS